MVWALWTDAGCMITQENIQDLQGRIDVLTEQALSEERVADRRIRADRREAERRAELKEALAGWAGRRRVADRRRS